MNHIYKSIFNKALGVFTAVPEFASAHGKGSERTVVGRVAKGTAGFAASALAISIGLALTSTSAVGYPGIYINDRQAGNCTAINDSAIPNLGVGTILDVNSTPGSVVLRVPGTSTAPAGVTPSHYNAAGSARPCEAIGNSTVDNRETQTNRTLFYGGPGAATEADEVNNENNGAKNLTLGGRLDVNSGIIGVGDRGVNGDHSTNSIRMGMGTALSDANKQVDAITIGVNAGASAKHATAIGSATTAKTGYSTALGYKAQAGDPAVTLLNGEYATAIGGQAKALNAQATAVGAESVASGVGQTSIGAYAGKNGTGDQVRQSYGVFIGRFAGSDNQNPNAATEGGNNYGVSIGESAGRYGQGGTRNTAIGEQAGQYLKGSYNIAMGTNAGSGSATDKLEVSNTTAIGNAAKALTHNSISIGLNSKSGKADAFGGENSIAIGNTAEAMGTSSMAMGMRASTSNGHDAIALGTYATTENQKATVIGSYSAATGRQSLTIANNYDSKNLKPVSVASGARATVIGAETTVSGDNSVAIGDTNTVASRRTYVMGNNINAAAGTDDSLAFGTKASVGGANAIALGNTAKATKENTIAQGTESVVYGKNSVSIGYKAVSGIETPTPTQTNAFSVSIGNETEAIDASTIAIGDKAKAKGGVDALAVGTQANAMTYKALAIGAYSQATGRQSTVIGNDIQGQPSIASGTRSQILGVQSNVSGDNSVSIGDTNTIASARTYALGNNINAAAGTDDSLVFGTRAAVSARDTIAMGNTAQAKTRHSIAIGQDSSAGDDSANAEQKGVSAVAIGHGAQANYYDAIAIGARATVAPAAGNTTAADSIAIGVEATADNYKTTAIGTYARAKGRQSTVIANNVQGSNYSTASGDRSQVYGVETTVSGNNSVAIGDTNNVASLRTYAMGNNISVSANASDSLALGSAVKVDGDSAIALGKNSAAAGNNQISIGVNAARNTTGGDNHASVYSVSIGTNAGADNASTAKDGNTEGVAIGYNAGRYVGTGIHNSAIGLNSGMYIQGSDNIAFGSNAGSGKKDAVLDINRTVAIGANALASKNNAVSIGGNSKAQDISSVAIGDTATAANANSVALGARSTTADVHTGDYTLNNSYTAAGLPVAANGTVSVGAAGKERQIQNVAAGVISATSTDAINGSQLYATNNYLSNLAGGVKNVLGGDAAVDNAGNLTMSNIGGTGKGNVNDAIAAANTKVAAGENITVTPTTNADGSKTYTVATKKDLVVDSVKAGDTTVNTDGVTIASGPSITKSGINANGRKVTGLVDGDINATSTDAVNGSQLHATNTKLADVENTANTAVQEIESANPDALSVKKDGTKVTLTPNVIAGDLVNPATGAVNTPAAGDAGKLVTAGTVANALANTHFVVDTKATTGGELDGASQADQKIKSGNKVTLQAGKNLKAKQTNGTDGAQVEFSLKDSISLTQVTAGTGANQVVLGNDGVKVGGNTYINNDGLNANNKPISNVADGVKPKDAVNKGQLDAVAQEAAKHTTVKAGKNVEVTEGANAAGGKEYTVKTADNLNVTSVKAGDSTLNTDGLTIAGGPSVKKDGINAGNKKITGVANGNVAAGSKEAVNGGQLAEVKAKADSAVQNVVSANPTALTATKAGDTVTLTPNFIAGDLVNADGTVKDPAAADEGKLVSAKTVADALKANHFVVDTKANGGTVDAASEENAKVGSGNKVTFEAGKNLVAQQTNTANGGATVNYKLSDTLENLVSVKSAEIEAGIGPNKVVLNNNGVKVGDSTLNDKGLTINNGPSVTDAGIDAGNKKITGVADGNVAAGSTDAVNGGQLAEVKAKADSAVQDVKSGDENALTAVKDPNTNIVTVTPKLSGDLVDANGNITAPTTPAEKGKLVTAGTVAEALANTHFVVDTKATDGELDAASQADQKIKASNKVTLQAGKNLKAKQTNGANGAEVEFSLKDSISLKEVKVGEGSANEVVLNNNGVNVAGNTYINKDGLNANDKKITNVAPGAVTAASKDAVNGSQLYNVANNVKDLIGPDAAIDPATGKVTVADPAKGIGETGKGNIGDAIKHVNDAAKAAAETAAKHTTVVEGKNVKVTKGKNAAGGDEYTVATKDDLDVTSVTAGNATVNTNGLTITGGPSVTRGGIDAGNRVISGVKAGDVSATSQEAVNGSQLHATNTKLDGVKAKADTAVQDVKSGDENALTAVKDPNTNIVTVTPKLSGNLVDANGNITAPTTPEEKGKLVTAGTVADALANTHFVVDTKATDGELDAASQADQKIKAGNKVTLQAGKNLKAKQTNGANGAQVEFSLKDSISLKEVTAGEGANQVVLGNDGVKVGGNTYINNAGLNANGNKITNVADGVDPTDAVNKGQLDAVKTVADSAVKSVDVANGEENLVVDNTDPKNPKLSLKKDLTVDSVKAGDSTLNTDGLTIAGGPSVKKDGINAGDKTITNVAPGAVTPTSKDAVNGGQLYNVANNVKDLIGPDAAIDPATGKVTVADPAKGIGETGKDNIGDAIKHVNDAAKAAADTAKKHTTVEQGDNIVVEESTNADGGKHYKVSTAKNLNVDSVKAGDTTVNNDGVTIAGGPSVTKGGINAGGNTITNVADGVNPNDAVNKGQLDAVKGVADSAVKSVDVANGEQNLVVDNSDPKNPKLSLKKDLTVDSVKAGDSTLNNDGLTIAGGPSVKKDGIDAGDKKITNVAAGDVAENSKDAVNGGQLYDVAKNVADLVGPDAKIDPATGKVTVADPTKGIGETGKGNIGDAIKHVNDLAKNAADTAKKHTTVEQGDNIVVEESTNADGGKHYKVSTAKNLNVDSVKAGDTTVNNDGVTIAGGPSVTKGGINAGGNTITNVADGVNPDDAVNKGQLDKVDTKVSNVAQNVVNVLGGDAAVNGNGDITMTNIGETGKGNINDAIKSVNDLAKKAAAEKTSVKAKEGRSNVTVTEGVNAAGGHEYTVDVERSVTNAGSDYVTVTNNHDADSNTTTYTVDVSAKTKASLAKADSAVQGLTSKDGNLNFTKGANGNVEVSFNDNLNVKNVTTDRVQVANGPSMSKDGINAAGKAISNVANGNVAADSKDAVNGGQLHETAKSVADVIGGGATVKDGKVVAGQNGIGNTGQNTVHGAIAAINQNTANNFNQIRGDLRKMDRDLRGGIAGALATAGLPQAFRPGKSMVAAAASTYRGQSGLAIGVSRISDNGKVILKVTGNTNSRGDFGGTIGAGYQW